MNRTGAPGREAMKSDHYASRRPKDRAPVRISKGRQKDATLIAKAFNQGLYRGRDGSYFLISAGTGARSALTRSQALEWARQLKLYVV